MRKFFSTTCTLEGLPPLTVEILIGHRASLGLTGVYFKPTPNDLLEGNDKMWGYSNVMKSLTISEEHKLRLEVKKLSAKNDDSQHLINASLKEKDKQIEFLMTKQENTEQLIQSLIDSGQLKSKQ
jgi:hypothetical protein